MGEVTFDIGPGTWMRICAMGAEGDGVGVTVGAGVSVSVGVNVRVGISVSVGVTLGVPARLVAMAACPVKTTTVGKYSGGNGVGPVSVVGGTHPARSPRRDASREKWSRVLCFIC